MRAHTIAKSVRPTQPRWPSAGNQCDRVTWSNGLVTLALSPTCLARQGLERILYLDSPLASRAVSVELSIDYGDVRWDF